jgi:hypothetical protein
MTKLESLINDEADKAYKWAVKSLKAEDPALAYEYGVRSGFKAGANAILCMLDKDCVGMATQRTFYNELVSECAKEIGE